MTCTPRATWTALSVALATLVGVSASCGDEDPVTITAKKGEACRGCQCTGVHGDSDCHDDCETCPPSAFDPEERVLLRCAGGTWQIDAFCAGGGEARCPGPNRCTGHDGTPDGYRYGSDKVGTVGGACRPCEPCDAAKGPCRECVSCDTFAQDSARSSILKCGLDGTWQLLGADCVGPTRVQCHEVAKTVVICLDEHGGNKFGRVEDAGP